MTQNMVDKVQVEQFLATLTDKDRQILTMRMEGLTHQEIADKLGYRNHSGVLKRIRKIGEQYENFTGTDLGF
jgi:DNA-directed RNA polymerase specialized sigma24 family protein